MYFGANYQSLFVGSLDGENPSQVRLNCCGTNSDYHRMIFTLGNRVVDNQKNQLYSQTLYRVLVHMKSDAINGKIELFVSDGYNLSYTGNVNNGNDFANVYIQASNYNNITTYPYVSNVIISNGEIRLGENCKVSIENQYDVLRNTIYPLNLFYDVVRKVNFGTEISETFDAIRNVTKSVEIFFDTARTFKEIWRYENYGTTELLLAGTHDVTVTDLPVTKSITGSAFKTYYDSFNVQNGYESIKKFDIPAAKEIWIKFDLYIESSSGTDIQVGSKDSANVGIAGYNVSICNSSVAFLNGYSVGADYIVQELRRVLVHMKSSSTEGIIELFLDNGFYANYTGNVNNGNYFGNVYIAEGYSDYRYADEVSDFLISNVIISNAPLKLTDNVSTITNTIEVTIDFDIIRYVSAWRYEDSGTAELLLSGVSGLEAVTSEVDIEKSRTGHAYYDNSFYGYYYPTTSTRRKQFDIPPTNEIWIKFDVYFEYVHTERYRIYIGSIDDNSGANEAGIIGLGGLNGNFTKIIYANNVEVSSAPNDASKKFSALKIHRVLVHMKSDATNGIIELFLDNGDYAFYTGSVHDGSEFKNVYITVWRSSKLLLSNIIISNAAIGLYEDISALVYPKEMAVDFDVARERGTWRYENYGTADLLTVEGTTVTDLPATQSKTGSAFYQTQYSRCFDVPATDEVWIKFDVYGNDDFRVVNINAADESQYDGIDVNFTNENGNVIYRIKQISSEYGFVSSVLNANVLTTCILHMKSGITDGLLEFWVNGERVVNATDGIVNDGRSLDKLTIQSLYGETLFSNVIISNEELYFYERYQKIYFDVIRLLTAPIEIDYDTVRTMPHSVMLSTIEQSGEITPGTGTPTTENDTGGLQSIEISIAEQELTDRVSFTGTLPMQILDQIKGQYLDYEYNMRVESRNHQGVLYTYNCCSDIDEILYKQLDYKIPENETIYLDASGNEMSHRNTNEEEESVPIARASKHATEPPHD